MEVTNGLSQVTGLRFGLICPLGRGTLEVT